MPARELAASCCSWRKGRQEREEELWTCAVWAKAAQRTHISDFIFMNYSVTDSYRCHWAAAVLPEPRSLCASIEHPYLVFSSFLSPCLSLCLPYLSTSSV